MGHRRVVLYSIVKGALLRGAKGAFAFSLPKFQEIRSTYSVPYSCFIQEEFSLEENV